jgi:hypothetical protein
MSCIHARKYGITYGRGECPECAAILEEMEEPEQEPKARSAPEPKAKGPHP